LTNVKNQEKETKSIKELLEAHNNETGSIKVGRKEIGAKLERLSAAIEVLIAEYKHIDQ
jgi:ribosomal protein L7Ae-like RNA K-turn-binding protein